MAVASEFGVHAAVVPRSLVTLHPVFKSRCGTVATSSVLRDIPSLAYCAPRRASTLLVPLATIKVYLTFVDS